MNEAMTPLEWERACAALTWLVRQEYPDRFSLVQIAEVWGEASPEQIETLRLLESDER